MVWKAQLVSVDGHAVVKKIWFPEANAPKTLQEMCLKGPAIKPRPPTFNDQKKKKKGGGRTIYDVTPKPPPQVAPRPPLPTYVYNPITTDYSYMRYAMSLGVGGDIWGGEESDRSHPPELVHSRESSPASSSSGSSMSVGSPSSSIGGGNFGHRFSSPPFVASASGFAGGSSRGSSYSYGPTSSISSSTSRGEIYDISMADPSLADFTYESIHFPTERVVPEDEMSFHFEEIRESLVDPFTNTEVFGVYS